MDKKYNLNELLSKFNKGFELYNTSPLFNNAINNLLNNGDIYSILEHVIVTYEITKKEYVKNIREGNIRTIITTQENIDKMLNNE